MTNYCYLPEELEELEVRPEEPVLWVRGVGVLAEVGTGELVLTASLVLVDSGVWAYCMPS